MLASLSGAFRRIAGLQPRARLESAMRSRRLAAWVPPVRNLNTQVLSDGDLTLRRAREIVLSNPIAANACEAFVANLIGDRHQTIVAHRGRRGEACGSSASGSPGPTRRMPTA